MKMRKLIIMRGCPGAGKSTLAREVCGRLGGKRYSADDMQTNGSDYVWTIELAPTAHRIVRHLVELAMLRGEPAIVVDNTNIHVREARPYADLAERHGYGVEVVEPDTPWKHDLDGLMARGTHDVPRERVEQMLNAWKSLPAAEFEALLLEKA